MKALITRKVGMTSTMADDGSMNAVTLLSATPCTVTQIKTAEKDGYQSVQVGFEEVKEVNNAQKNHLKKSKVLPKVIREFRTEHLDLPEDLAVGSKLTPEVFSVGDVVDVVGTSKGKGFAGTIKRHNFSRQRVSHGGNGNVRKVGSIGSMYPQKIFKGKKMPGHMGSARNTIKNLKISIVDVDKNIIAVTGAVPGPNGGIILLKGVK